MWWLFQVLIMILIIGSNGAFPWAPKGRGLPWRYWPLLQRTGYRFGSTTSCFGYAASANRPLQMVKK
jgi:hypothetical protein